MQRVTGVELEPHLPFLEEATTEAKLATCHRAKCGAVLVKDGVVIGRGFNGPEGDEANRTCDREFDLSIKPQFDKTCCIHAEWAAIHDACVIQENADKIEGSTLYFMRVDDEGEFVDAGEPRCTTCSRLTLLFGIGQFVLYNAGGADIYEAIEYNQVSYAYFRTPRLN